MKKILNDCYTLGSNKSLFEAAVCLTSASEAAVGVKTGCHDFIPQMLLSLSGHV